MHPFVGYSEVITNTEHFQGEGKKCWGEKARALGYSPVRTDVVGGKKRVAAAQREK